MSGFTVLTVSQLNRYVKGLLDENPKLREVYLKGEISNFTNHYRSGHFYMTLKDGTASVKAVMFAEYARRVSFVPTEGMSVIVRASVSLFERDGSYQIYLYDMQPDGLGAVWLAFVQLKERLEKAGLFDPSHKKTLPAMPQKIGVITSATGAAYRDIINILERRWPLATVLFCPATVQGEQAAASLVAALRRLDGCCDVIIIGRGGGSIEDLWCFNSEYLAQAIYKCSTPVISAVGHETDYTICDFVADMRAPTPSAAAELATPDKTDVNMSLLSFEKKLRAAMQTKIYTQKAQLTGLKREIYAKNPSILLSQNRQNLKYLIKLLTSGYVNVLAEKRGRIDRTAITLDRLNPVAVLRRGYTITLDDQNQPAHAKSLREGGQLRTLLADGEVISKIEQVKKGVLPDEKTTEL